MCQTRSGIISSTAVSEYLDNQLTANLLWSIVPAILIHRYALSVLGNERRAKEKNEIKIEIQFLRRQGSL